MHIQRRGTRPFSYCLDVTTQILKTAPALWQLDSICRTDQEGLLRRDREISTVGRRAGIDDEPGVRKYCNG